MIYIYSTINSRVVYHIYYYSIKYYALCRESITINPATLSTGESAHGVQR